MSVPAPEGTPPADPTPPADGTPPDDGTPPAEGEGTEETTLEKTLRKERDERKRLEGVLKAREQEDEKARLAAMDDNARAIEEAKAAARAETASEYEQRILGLRAQSRASSFHDPDLAVKLLELKGDPTDAEIDAALAALAKDKPYLVKTASGVPPTPQGPRSPAGQAGDPNDWLRRTVAAKS
jgi:hypothetical protein